MPHKQNGRALEVLKKVKTFSNVLFQRSFGEVSVYISAFISNQVKSFVALLIVDVSRG